jgi:hypothetical protein
MEINMSVGESESIEFLLNPLLAEIVLWNDIEICNARPVLRQIEKADRLMTICQELSTRGVAVLRRHQNMLWIPTKDIERQSGGSNITSPFQFQLTGHPAHPDLPRFHKVMERQLERRLDFIVLKSVAGFASVNAGFTKVSGTDADGCLRFALTDIGKHFVGTGSPIH